MKLKRFCIPKSEKKAIIKQLSDIVKKKQDVLFSFLYGSFAESEKFGDIDIGVYLDESYAKDYLDYEVSLYSELKKVVRYPLDIRVINSAPLIFRYKVTRFLLLSNRDEKALSTFLERTWGEYFDFLPIALPYLKEVFMNNIDVMRVRELTGIITDSLYKLRELGKLSKKEFLSDFRNTESAKYLLIKATEAALDICNHIASKKGGRAPQDYADCFVVLKEIGVINEDLSDKMVKMARFRNLIVHLYWKVDDAQVFDIIKNNLGDLEDFIKHII
ncbi:MAG TPA: DUF86 domain-containing protein [Methanosarcinales archaeon]|nr:DUF86 domain-containing protein [Methanosarcinales archaeon]